ncbi:hypothetical protein [Rosenbergiella metrosideri]|uniref:hypothetical protein n=1 Tax=Rosenbergiella metrosideri TaxID=2921185 RepID=UPI001F4FDCD8|nr:hypothetical protein [Rosenbergiella metrosideri]
MLFSGRLAGHFGCRAVIIDGLSYLSLSSDCQIDSDNNPEFRCLRGWGKVNGCDNIQGALIDQKSSEPLMPGFYGLCSLLGIMGAVGVSVSVVDCQR